MLHSNTATWDGIDKLSNPTKWKGLPVEMATGSSEMFMGEMITNHQILGCQTNLHLSAVPD